MSTGQNSSKKERGFWALNHSILEQPSHYMTHRDQWETINDYQTFSIGFNDEE